MIPAQLSRHDSLAAQEPAHPSAYVWKIAFTAALGGLLFGCDWVVIGGAKHFYELYFHIHSSWLSGWANSCALLGCLAGSLLAGALSDTLGRRKSLIISAISFVVTSIFTGCAFNLVSFIAWRIAGGVAIGIACNVAPVYIAEISPPSSRGRLVSLNQLTIVLGILLAQVINWLIADRIGQSDLAWNAAVGWRWMFIAVAVPAVIFFVLSLSLPESPRWLCLRGKVLLAQQTLQRIGGESYAHSEITAILAAANAPHPPAASLAQLFRPNHRTLTIVACLLTVLQQWCGVNILFNYADDIYRAAGYTISQTLFNIIITGAINLLATCVAMAVIDRLGRRVLMLFGCFGIGLAHLIAAFAYSRHVMGTPVLLVTLAAIACYAGSLAPVTWVLLTELFPTRIRSKGVSLATSCLWIASFLVTYSFPSLVQHYGMSRTFLLYALICAAGAVLVGFFIPETKGRSLEELDFELVTPPQSLGAGKAIRAVVRSLWHLSDIRLPMSTPASSHHPGPMKGNSALRVSWNFSHDSNVLGRLLIHNLSPPRIASVACRAIGLHIKPPCDTTPGSEYYGDNEVNTTPEGVGCSLESSPRQIQLTLRLTY